MKTSVVVWSVLLWGSVSLAALRVSAAEVSVPKAPELGAKQKVITTFAETVQDFQKQDPNSEELPRLWLEVMMHAEVQKLEAMSQAARGELLLRYPLSLPASYLRLQIKEHKDYRELLVKALDRSVVQQEPVPEAKLAAALELGLDQYGTEFLKPVAVATLAQRVGRATQHFRLSQLSEQQAQELKPEDLELYQILTSAEKTSLEKYLAVQDRDQLEFGSYFRQTFYQQLSSEEQQSRAVQIGVARQHLLKNQRAEARQLLETLCASEPDPKLLFWKAWMNLTDATPSRDLEQVAEEFQALIDEYPDSPEAAMTRQFVMQLPQQKALLAEQLTSVWAKTWLSSLFMETKGWRCEVIYPEAKTPWGVSVFYRPQPAELEILLADLQQPFLIYHVTEAQTSVYVRGAKVINRFERGGFVPVVTMKLSTVDGQENFNLGAQFVSKEQALKQWGEILLKSHKPLLQSLFSQATVSHSLLVGEQRTTEQGSEVDYLRYDRRSHDLERLTCRFDQNQLFTEAELHVQDLTLQLKIYPAQEQGELPGWPECPVETHPEFDFAKAAELMGRLVKIFSELTEKKGENS